MTGIKNAMVLYDVQEDRGLTRKRECTASVSVSTIGGMQLDETKVMAIRHLVASAIAGMSPESVVVADLDTGFTYAATKQGQQVPARKIRIFKTKLFTKKSGRRKSEVC